MADSFVEPSNGLPIGDRLALLRSLTPILLPDERDPKQLVDLILETSEVLTERRIASESNLAELADDERAWLLISAVYTGARGLARVARASADSRIAAEFLATFFALSHMRPWRETVYRIAIVFSIFTPENQKFCQSLIDRIVVHPQPTDWELSAIGAAVDGGVEQVIAELRRNALRLSLPEDRVASFLRCLDD